MAYKNALKEKTLVNYREWLDDKSGLGAVHVIIEQWEYPDAKVHVYADVTISDGFHAASFCISGGEADDFKGLEDLGQSFQSIADCLLLSVAKLKESDDDTDV